jgi:hypothetical protein
MRSPDACHLPKTVNADLSFAAVLHDPALEIVLTKCRAALARGPLPKCLNPDITLAAERRLVAVTIDAHRSTSRL